MKFGGAEGVAAGAAEKDSARGGGFGLNHQMVNCTISHKYFFLVLTF